MKLSFNSWTYASYPTWLPVRRLEDVVDMLAEIGYEGIEIGGAAPHGFPDYLSGGRRTAIARHVEMSGLEISALIPALGGAAGLNPVSPEDAERAAHRAYMNSLIELAHDLSCDTVIFLGGWRRHGQTYDDAWKHSRDSLQSAAEYGATRGVRIVVEPTGTASNLIERTGDCQRLIEAAGGDAGIMLDTGHIFQRNDDIRDALHEPGAQLEYLHVADLDRTAPGTHTDFTSMIVGLRDVGYQGWLSMEIGLDRREIDADAMARQAFDHIKGLLERYA